jgi:hypothetical protein
MFETGVPNARLLRNHRRIIEPQPPQAPQIPQARHAAHANTSNSYIDKLPEHHSDHPNISTNSHTAAQFHVKPTPQNKRVHTNLVFGSLFVHPSIHCLESKAIHILNLNV